MGDLLDGPSRTGHDIHFLSRLKRVQSAETDLALRLYRSPDVVRALFEGAAVPPAADRIAVAIAEGHQPPHVLIARDGAFVTCLGAGMSTGELPVLPFRQLAGVLRREDIRAAEERRATDVLETFASETMFDKVYGNRLPREEFQALSALAPLMHAQYAQSLAEFTVECMTSGAAMARIKCPPRPPDDVALSSFWRMFHATGNLVQLIGSAGKRVFDVWEEVSPELREPYHMWLQPARFGYLPIALRVFWTLARAGKLALPELKRELDAAQNHLQWIPVVLALAAVAARHRRERAEALGLINPARLPPMIRDHPTIRDWARQLQDSVRDAIDELPEEPEGLPAVLHEFAKDRLLCDLDGAMTDELAPPACANFPLLYLDDVGLLPTVLRLTVLTARLPPEQFYYPESALRHAERYTHEGAVELASLLDFRSQPIKAAPKPGRNEPCPCGSGKKYKKCCGQSSTGHG